MDVFEIIDLLKQENERLQQMLRELEEFVPLEQPWWANKEDAKVCATKRYLQFKHRNINYLSRADPKIKQMRWWGHFNTTHHPLANARTLTKGG